MLPVVASFLIALAPPAPVVHAGKVYAAGKPFLARLAYTDQEKANGLMRVANLPANECMFFVYNEDYPHSIWMKNCLISLDVAFVDGAGRVVEMAEKVPPASPLMGDNCPTYGGSVPSRHFIEFPAGTFKRIGLKKGDVMGWDLTLPDGQHFRGGQVPGEKAPAKPRK